MLPSSFACAACKTVFMQPPLCVTCGAQRLHDAMSRRTETQLRHGQHLLRQALLRVDKDDPANQYLLQLCAKFLGDLEVQQEG